MTMSQRVALLDNTVQIDRQKSESRRKHIEKILDGYDWKVSTSICLLEFKATLIQQCITIHDKLRLVGLYTRVADYLTESQHPQAKLRRHILANLVNVFAPSSFDVTEEQDRRLADKARLLLEHIIPRLYNWFRERSVDAILHDGVNCTRAMEQPQKQRVAFGVNLPTCDKRNKSCRVEEFVRERAQQFLERLETFRSSMNSDPSAQLEKTCILFREILENPELQLSHANCRTAGDCLIAMEGCRGGSVETHAISTNAREWEVICRTLGCEFVKVTYPTLESRDCD